MHYERSIILIILACLLAACGATNASKVVEAQIAIFPTSIPSTALAPTMGVPIATSTNSTTPTPFPALPPAGCPITQPPSPPFIPPAPYPPQASEDSVWYGTDALWTRVRQHGIWSGLPHNPAGYTQKVFWWRNGYSWADEPTPALSVVGRRIDAAAPPLHVSRATNAFADDINSAMLVGVDFPTLGCWEITGKYADQELSFIVWVAP